MPCLLSKIIIQKIIIIYIYIYKDDEGKVKYYLLDAINQLYNIYGLTKTFQEHNNNLNIIDISNNDICLRDNIKNANIVPQIRDIGCDWLHLSAAKHLMKLDENGKPLFVDMVSSGKVPLGVAKYTERDKVLKCSYEDNTLEAGKYKGKKVTEYIKTKTKIKNHKNQTLLDTVLKKEAKYNLFASNVDMLHDRLVKKSLVNKTVSENQKKEDIENFFKSHSDAFNKYNGLVSDLISKEFSPNLNKISNQMFNNKDNPLDYFLNTPFLELKQEYPEIYDKINDSLKNGEQINYKDTLSPQDIKLYNECKTIIDNNISAEDRKILKYDELLEQNDIIDFIHKIINPDNEDKNKDVYDLLKSYDKYIMWRIGGDKREILCSVIEVINEMTQQKIDFEKQQKKPLGPTRFMSQFNGRRLRW